MSTLDVKIPDGMDGDIQAFIQEYPHYLSKSESVRDALCPLIESQRLSNHYFDPQEESPRPARGR